MRLGILFIFALLFNYGYSQSASQHYKSPVNGYLTSGTISSTDHIQSVVVNTWTEGQIQRSANYINMKNVVLPGVHVGISESPLLDEANLNIFPNPTSDNISIIYSGKYQINQIQIISLNGSNVGLQQVFHNQTKIDVSDLQKGIYWLKLKGDFGEVTKKMVIL